VDGARVDAGLGADENACVNAKSRRAVLVAWLATAALPALPPGAARAGPEEPAPDVLAMLREGEDLLSLWDLDGARTRFQQAAAALRARGAPPDWELDPRLLWLAARAGLAEAESRMAGAMSSNTLGNWAEAVAAADVVAKDGALGAPEAGFAMRLRLAEALREDGRAADAEAAAWEAFEVGAALGAEREDALARFGPLLAVLLGAVRDGNPEESGGLASLLTEIDVALSALPAYRMHLPPPPDAVVSLIEEHGKSLAAAGDVERAEDAFESVLALDEARAAARRLEADLSQLGWARIQLADWDGAREVLERARKLAPDQRPSAETAANLAILETAGWRRPAAQKSGQRPDRRAALTYARWAVEDAPAEPPWARAALLARQALVEELFGGVDAALAGRRLAAAAFRGAAQEDGALLEEARLVRLLAERGRRDEARKRLASLPAELPPPAQAQRLAAEWALLDAGFTGASGAEFLDRLGEWFFEQEDAESLMGVAALPVTIALRAGDLASAEDAALNAIAFEESLGLEAEGYEALLALARVREAQGRPSDARALQVQAVARAEWLAARLERAPWEPRFVPGESDAPLLERSLSMRIRFAKLKLERRRPGWTAAVADRTDAPMLEVAPGAWERWTRGLGSMTTAHGDPSLLLAQRHTEALRQRMREVSFRGGDRPPAELRAELLPRLRAAMQREHELGGLPPPPPIDPAWLVRHEPRPQAPPETLRGPPSEEEPARAPDP
jgi:tetratricopeptide (TPR) repeat protein